MEVRDGAVDDADTAELVAGRKVWGREGREGQTEAPRERKVDELCSLLLGGKWSGRSGEGNVPLAVALSSWYVLSSFHPVAP